MTNYLEVKNLSKFFDSFQLHNILSRSLKAISWG